MKRFALPVFFLLILTSCNSRAPEAVQPSLQGTWQLLTGTLVENGDTTITDYTHHGISFIKIINDTHFAFLQHNTGKDSAAGFSAGGGAYTLHDSTYTEHLAYCSAKEWEGNDFSFAISMHNDTLIQRGVEKVEKAGINRINTEVYVRVKK